MTKIKSSYKQVPKEQRKKILLICDDIRVHSGVANVAREIVVHTSHIFNWSQVAGTIKHPEKGTRVDLSKATTDIGGAEDAQVMIYPVDGYGNPSILREVIQYENPDAILLITDPRYFIWVFGMENELRKKIPIVYLNIWDDLPAPMYNLGYYDACDMLLGISKQTVNINKMVLGEKAKNKIIKYLPHGVDPETFYPIQIEDKDYPEYVEFRDKIFKDKSYPEFIIFFNSRNMRRKAIPDTILAFKSFLDRLEPSEAAGCFMIMHTEVVSEHGTDLEKVKEYFLGEKYSNNLIFSTGRLDTKYLNFFYNMASLQVLVSSNEGWGLSLTEAMLTGTPFIANVTGGMQDQMRFSDDSGWIDFNEDLPSLNEYDNVTICLDGTSEQGEWAFPVFPASRSLQGSPLTPYIFDDRCKWEDVSRRMYEAYAMDRGDLAEKGNKGREWAMSDEAGFTSSKQGERFIAAMVELFETWEPKDDIELINTNEYKGKFLNHHV